MSKDTLTIAGILLAGFIGLAGLMLHLSGSISELRTELRTDIRALSARVEALEKQVARLEVRMTEMERRTGWRNDERPRRSAHRGADD